MAEITATLVKDLREKTGAGILDCKKALTEAGGDLEAAVDWLRKKGLSAAAKKSGRVAAEGLIGVASAPLVAAMVEVNSETDFVARNPKFAELARDIAMHVAAMSPRYLDRESVPSDEVERLRAEFRASVPPGKPAEVGDRIVEGKLNKWFEEHCLLDQAFVKDDAVSVGELIHRAVGSLGEKIRVRRFTRFALSE